MANEIIDLDPVEHFTVNTVGEPEERMFLLQGQSDDILVTLIIDQDQALALSLAGSELLEMLEGHYSREINQFQIPPVEKMALRTPIEPLFQVSQFQLGYDDQRDYIVVITAELSFNGELDVQNLNVVRFWITREQMLGLIRQIDQVIAAGPPICPACGQPIEPDGHKCIRNN